LSPPSLLRLGLSSGLFPSGFPTKTLYTFKWTLVLFLCEIYRCYVLFMVETAALSDQVLLLRAVNSCNNYNHDIIKFICIVLRLRMHGVCNPLPLLIRLHGLGLGLGTDSHF
jgi:hypothetical protein